MVRALRVVTVQRGIDPRRYALLAFGGAGPLHAAAIADELGITEIVCPRASGVLAALGLVVSPRRRDVQRTRAAVRRRADAPRRSRRLTDELGERRARSSGSATPSCARPTSCAIAARRSSSPSGPQPQPEPAQLREAFEALHEERYGYRDPEQELELVTIRVSATVPGADVTLDAGDDGDWAAALATRRERSTAAGSSSTCCAARPRPGP